MRGLTVEVVLKRKRLPVETWLMIADLAHGLAHGGLDLLQRARRPLAALVNALAADLARQHHLLRGGERFAGDPRLGVLRQEEIDNRVRNLVGNLVRMTFRSEEPTS